MKLLHFAHRGEAQEFISALKFKPYDYCFSGIYKNEDYILLISGEGINETAKKVSAVLAHFPQIESVINYGIAGSLNSKAAIDNIYTVRTVYAHSDSKPFFQSFSSADNSGLDCITATERVLDDKFANNLSTFAQVVDRELWGLASSCKTMQIPFYSYKLISDIAGKSTNCFDIKNQALEYSKTMLKHFFNLNQSTERLTVENQLFSHSGLHITFSQEKKLDRLLTQLSGKYDIENTLILEKVNYTEITEMDVRPKAKTQLLIKRLEHLLNPFLDKIEQALTIHTHPIDSIGAHIIFDKNYENDSINLNMKINDQKNIENLKHVLQNFDYTKVKSILNGNL